MTRQVTSVIWLWKKWQAMSCFPASIPPVVVQFRWCIPRKRITRIHASSVHTVVLARVHPASGRDRWNKWCLILLWVIRALRPYKVLTFILIQFILSFFIKKTSLYIALCVFIGEDIVFLATDINLPGAVDWVMMQSCFGHHFMLVLEKQEKYDGHQQFFAIVQLIGSRKQAENFAYR